jgi:hypothetical protein
MTRTRRWLSASRLGPPPCRDLPSPFTVVHSVPSCASLSSSSAAASRSKASSRAAAAWSAMNCAAPLHLRGSPARVVVLVLSLARVGPAIGAVPHFDGRRAVHLCYQHFVRDGLAAIGTGSPGGFVPLSHVADAKARVATAAIIPPRCPQIFRDLTDEQSIRPSGAPARNLL